MTTAKTLKKSQKQIFLCCRNFQLCTNMSKFMKNERYFDIQLRFSEFTALSKIREEAEYCKQINKQTVLSKRKDVKLFHKHFY